MILAQFIFVGIVLLLAVATPLPNKKQDGDRIAYNNQDPHAWERGGEFQGDMVLTPAQIERYYNRNGQRNALIDPELHWPDNTIPYEISSDFSDTERAFIVETLEEDFGRTCIRVVPHTDELDYVYITATNKGCSSSVGCQGGMQTLNLQPDLYLNYSVVVHEYLHAAGFYHQHAASDRDDYVTIMWDNIDPAIWHNFDKSEDDEISNFGQPYDYASVMHYHEYTGSWNGEKTIVPHDENVKIGKATKLSDIDINKLNKMYDC